MIAARILLVGVLAGNCPALILSSFRPVDIVNNNVNLK
jgi:hypothetical protein